jgi:nicotinamide mononucleotide transporter
MSAIVAALLSLEGLAVVLALAYLLLAARENIWCWFCAFSSSALYVVIMWEAGLFTEAVLNVFYIAMAVLGWYEWKYGGKQHAGVAIVSLKWWQHVALFAAMLLLAFANGWAMQRWTSAAWPFVDSFITWSSVITTFLIVRKVLENWLYWVVIDGLAIFVYIDRGLYLTALLFALYVVIVIFGYIKWRKLFVAQQVASGT